MAKRVAILGESFGIGGAERMTVDIADALKSRGHDVQVVTTLGKAGTFRGRLAQGVPAFFYPDAAALGKHLRSTRPDVMVLNNCRLASSLMPKLATELDGSKILALVHGCESLSLNLIPESAGYAGIVTVSETARAGIEERLPGWKDKVAVVEAAVDCDVFGPGASNVEFDGWPEDAIVFAYCGRMSGEKNLITLLDCFRRARQRLPKARLLLVGGVDDSAGPVLQKYWQGELETCERVMGQMGLTDDVLVTGVVEDPWQFLRASRVFVMTSRYEGTPLAMLEAMACGLPVVCPDVGNVREILDESGAGACVVRANENQEMNEHDRERFVAEMVRLALSPVATEFGRRGREYVMGRFGRERFGSEWHAVVEDFASVAGAKRTARAAQGAVEVLVDRPGYVFARIADRIKHAAPKVPVVRRYAIDKERIGSGIIFWWREWPLVDRPEESAVCLYDHASWTAQDIKTVFAKFKLVCVANDKLRGRLAEICPELKPKLIEVADGVDTATFCPGDRKPNERGRLRVGWVGSSKWAPTADEFKDVKGWKIVKGVWDRTKRFCDWFVVDSSQVPVPFEKMPEYYRGIDVLVCASECEGTPNPVLEAAACGCHVVTTDVGIVPEAMRDGMQAMVVPREEQSFVNALQKLDAQRGTLKDALERNPRVMRERWDWIVKGKAWAEVTDRLRGKRDLREHVTVFVSTVGAPDFPHCMAALEKQDCLFNLDVVKNVAPMSAAFNAMIERCKTPYYVQVDEDMILRPDAVRKLYERITWTGARTAFYFLCLRDRFIGKTLVGVKIYRHEAIKRFPFQDDYSCEVSQLDRMKAEGYGIEGEFPGIDCAADHPAVAGDLNCHWTPWTVFEKYTRDMQKYKRDGGKKMAWMAELPKWLADKYRKEGTREALFAVLGCAAGLSAPLVEEGEKDFRKPRFRAVFDELEKGFRL